MALLPWFMSIIDAFMPVFSRRVWPQVQLLLIGAILATGQRTVVAALRILGLADESRFVTSGLVRCSARCNAGFLTITGG